MKVNPLSGEPGIVFNGALRPDANGVMKPACAGILSELGAYPSPFYESPRWEIYSNKTDREGNVIAGDPDDKFNDAVKATIYGIVQHFGLVHYGESEHFTMSRYGTRSGMADMEGFRKKHGIFNPNPVTR